MPMGGTFGLSNMGPEANVQDFDFADLKVRRQPPPPGYPKAAFDRGVQSTVMVELSVNDKGFPTSADALSGQVELQMAAIRYGLTWEFEPVEFNGQPRPSPFKLVLPYKLQR